jgi:predicted TIM-barrel fold metal-dependent hydrolase
MTVTESASLAGVPKFLERAIDVDTHEMIPFHMWGEFFGEEVADRLTQLEHNPFWCDNGGNTIVRPDIAGDTTEITEDSVWHTKGPSAPSAFDLVRRCDVLNEMGVDKSLLFPGFGLTALMMTISPEFVSSVMNVGMDVARTRETGILAMAAYNDLAVRPIEGVDARRVRRVAVLATDDLDQMLSNLEDLIERGIRAVWIPSSVPPAGTSPADARLDPFWRMAADANVAIVLHIGTDFTFAASLAWGLNVPAFVPPKASAEFVISPFAGSTMQFATENYISAMVLGGVFERVPDLRFGAIELGAQWLGSLAERLDMWANVYQGALKNVISMPPSRYIARNVRVTPFHFEPVGLYFDRNPDLADCYCYSSDYPHVEGGQSAKAKFLESLTGQDEATLEKFFVSNGDWLTPDM